MKRPTIGITSPLYQLGEDGIADCEAKRHADMLEALGANAVILPRGRATAEALTTWKLQGILFSGGGDVSPTFYGGRAEFADDRVDATRDAGELALLRNAYAARTPTFCVCRGLQLANIAFGGTLMEDIKAELGAAYTIAHHQVRELDKPATEWTHKVRVQEGSALMGILGSEELWTNSVHHQAIRAVAAPFVAVAHADDGVIEAIELAARDFFFQAVQWHPESLPGDNASIRLYDAFVEAAAQE